jgi:hypothetical protein
MGEQDWPLAVCNLIASPRALKRVLAEILDGWKHLEGEVCVDDLIAISTLKIVHPEIFVFYAKNVQSILKEEVPADVQGEQEVPHRLDGLSSELDTIFNSYKIEGVRADAVRSILLFIDQRCSQFISLNVASKLNKRDRQNYLQTSDNILYGTLYLDRLITKTANQFGISDRLLVATAASGLSGDNENLNNLAKYVIESEFAFYRIIHPAFLTVGCRKKTYDELWWFAELLLIKIRERIEFSSENSELFAKMFICNIFRSRLLYKNNFLGRVNTIDTDR